MPPTLGSSQLSFRGKTEADRHFLRIALEERAKSDDPKAQLVPQSGVGAILVKGNQILARSANVLPTALKTRHTEEMRSISEEERYHFIEHAERAVIFKALLEGKSLTGGTIYCTRFACSDCARAIIWAGLRRAVFGAGYSGEQRWIASQRAAVDMLRFAGVVVRIMPLDQVA